MANMIINDEGESVGAIGAEGSQARVLCQYPALVKRINDIHSANDGDFGGSRADLAIEEIRRSGISDPKITNRLLEVSDYKNEVYFKVKA